MDRAGFWGIVKSGLDTVGLGYLSDTEGLVRKELDSCRVHEEHLGCRSSLGSSDRS